MAASDPAGQFQFWFNGAPFPGVRNGTKDVGQVQFWMSGAPALWLMPPNISTVNVLFFGGD